jgi:hypothetical protein
MNAPRLPDLDTSTVLFILANSSAMHSNAAEGFRSREEASPAERRGASLASSGAAPGAQTRQVFAPPRLFVVQAPSVYDGGDDYARWSGLGTSLGRVVRHVARVDDAAPRSHPFGDASPDGGGGAAGRSQDPPAAGSRAVTPADCCVVCMDSFCDVLRREDPELRGCRTTVCGHTFCSPCIEKWLSDSVSCPVCMRDLAVEGGVALRDERGTGAPALGTAPPSDWPPFRFGDGDFAGDQSSTFAIAEHIVTTMLSETLFGRGRRGASTPPWQIDPGAPRPRSYSAPPTPAPAQQAQQPYYGAGNAREAGSSLHGPRARRSVWGRGDPDHLFAAAYHFNQMAEIFGLFATRP